MSTPAILAVGEPTFRQQVALAMSLPPEAISWVGDAASAEKAVVESEGGTQLVAISPETGEGDALQIAEFANRVSPATAVVLVRSVSPNGSLTRFVRAGIRDVVDLSASPDDLTESLMRSLEWATSVQSQQGERGPYKESVGKIVSVFSSKGGTGKTFVASNLAAALAERSGRDTALIDLDFGSSDVFSYYGRDPRRSLEDLFAPHGLDDKATILHAATELGPHLWGYGSAPDPSVEAIPAPGVGKILRALQMNFDFVVVDSAAQYTDQVLSALDASDAIYLVASLDVVGIRHLVKSLETLTSIGIPRHVIRTILNRADSKVGLEASDVEKVTGIAIDAQIPSSRLVPMSLNKGIPVVVDDPNSPVAQSIGALADSMMRILLGDVNGSTDRPQRKRRLFARGT